MVSNDNSMVMPVSPLYGGNGGFGGDWGSWIILFLIFGMFNGGWGGYGGGNQLGYDFPWLLNGQSGINNNTNAGFQNAAVQSALGDIQTSLCGGFAGVNATVNNAQNALAQQLYANQIADMERSFNAQTASMQGFNGVQGQTADIKATILSENCQDRYEAAMNARDIITNATANTQAILNSNQRLMDKLCDQELQAERRENQNLRSELMYARGQASQIDQTAQIRAGQIATMNSLVNELRSCPIPSQPVYGSQPIFTCPGNGNFAFA